MKYALNANSSKSVNVFAAARSLWPLLREEKKNLALALAAIVVNSLVNLFGPFVIAHAVDTYVLPRDFHGVLMFSLVLLGMFVVGLCASYLQTKWMGSVSQRMLFRLRNTVFTKLQDLPVAFFQENKAGDLISRVNNDTDKLNQFFSQSLMQFIGSVFIMLGASIFLLTINVKLGAATLVPAVVILVVTRVMSPWIKRKNAASLQSTGDISAEIQESLNNFKVIVAFNRRDYFRTRFEESNVANYKSAVGAGIANNFFTPIYSFAASIAQLIVVAYGVALIMDGQFTLGLLISFLSYANSFYSPLRQLAALWANFQTAMAGWDRISAMLRMESDLDVKTGDDVATIDDGSVLAFRNVHFGYTPEKEVLHDSTFSLAHGKTYALVGPTGGGKTTTASLMARMFDPTQGTVFLNGKDIRAYTPEERAKRIGFILQEPFLFSGTVKDNILYGNTELAQLTDDDLAAVIKNAGLDELLTWFDEGLATKVSARGESMSLGQRQLIAFVRAVLRKPELLILDEATANIDTVTEQLLEKILAGLPASTTRVIIAHRLNTIENADEIFFVNDGTITPAGSMEHAVDMLLHGNSKS